jgi:hypothetical protein
MATVRFSDTLKDTIRTNAKLMFRDNIDKAKANVPSHWADKFYQSFFPADDIAKFNALPDYAMETKDNFDFSGFHNAPEDVFQTASHKQSAYKCDEVRLTFSKTMRWPSKLDESVTGFKFNWRQGTADYNDSRWAWLIPEFKEYVRGIFEQESKQESFLEGINKLMETYSTLAPALKAWPALWDLLDDDTKERHKKIVERKKKDTDQIGVDLNSMTAAVTFSKLTR